MAGIEIDGANQKIKLDSDGDTFIEAATDDTLKVNVAGAEDLRITANAINVLSGTTLTIDSGATITNSGTANGFGALAGIDDQSSSNDDQITISDTNVIINEDSDDVNFRVEGNLSQGLIFVDGSMDNVSIVGSEKNSTVAASAASQAFLQGSSSVFRIVGHNAEGASSILHASSTTNTVEPVLNLSKSANAAIGSYTCVAHNENIGMIVFTADDGTNLLTPAASIAAKIDATAGENDMPGRLEFATTKDGAASVTNRMYIYHNGTTQIIPGDSNNGYAFDGSVDSFYPFTNDNNDLGYANLKWDDVYATNGTIITSDKNEKDNINESDLGLDFVNKLKPVSYKYKDKTRTHYGLISQDIEDLLSDISKSSTDFAGFIKTQKEDNTKWTEDDPETQDAVLYTSEDDEVKKGIRSVGDIKQKASKEIGHFKHDLGTKKIDDEYTYGLRYEEFISPIIKAIQELSAKVKALEEAE